MLRRAFIRRMASAVVGVGLLGSELMGRKPEVEAGYIRITGFRLSDEWSRTWVSLHTGDPGSTGDHEVRAMGYTRARLPDGGLPNVDAIAFPECGTGETVRYWGLWVDDEYIVGGPLAASFTYSAGVTPMFAAGDLRLTDAA